jgi:hypothetical protein
VSTTIPSDFSAGTFADGELVNETKLYTRVLTVINTLFAWARAQYVVQTLTGSVTVSAGTAPSASTAVTFPNAYVAAPNVVVGLNTTDVGWCVGVSSITTTGCTVTVSTPATTGASHIEHFTVISVGN